MKSIDFYWEIFETLFPYPRSITGRGNQLTLEKLRDFGYDFKIHSKQSGTEVFDWTVPPQWNFYGASIKNCFGKEIVSSKHTNLCVVNYSDPLDEIVSDEVLLAHTHTLEQLPNAYPYRTSYYDRKWGFCIPYNILKSDDFRGPFEVKIDCELIEEGDLIYGESVIPGDCEKEILISTYICHPSMANDNLSGVILALMLIDHLKSLSSLKYTYRIILVPETIGAICFLKDNQDALDKIVAGMILSNTAGPDKISIKNSFDFNHWINKLAHHSISWTTNGDFIEYEFAPDGSDERQYSTPGVRINTPSFHKSKYHEFLEYHTSLDNMDFVSKNSILETFECYKLLIEGIESNSIPKLNIEIGEPFLSKRNLYPKTGGAIKQQASLNYSQQSQLDLDLFFKIWHHIDGVNDILEISEAVNANFFEVLPLIRLMQQKNLCKISSML